MDEEPSVYFSIYLIYMIASNKKIFGNTHQTLSIKLLLCYL